MKLSHLLPLSGCLIALFPGVTHAQDIFTFTGQTTIANSNFLIPAGNLTSHTAASTASTSLAANNNPARVVTFSISEPGGDATTAFQFENNGSTSNPNYGTNLSGVVLVDSSSLSNANSLTLTFIQPVSSLSLGFAITDFGDPYTLNLAVGGSTVRSYNSSGNTANATSANFESSFVYNPGTTFSSATISLTSTGVTTYALDNITVNPVAVPEPGTIAFLVGMGSIGAALLRRRRARA